MGRAPKNGLYGLCYQTGQTLGLRVTKRQFTNLRDGDIAGSYWIVHSLAYRSNRLRTLSGSLEPGIKGFDDLRDVARYFRSLLDEKERKGERIPDPEYTPPAPNMERIGVQDPIPEIPVEPVSLSEEIKREIANGLREIAAPAIIEKLDSIAQSAEERFASELRKKQRIEIVLPNRTEPVDIPEDSHIKFPELLAELGMGNGIRLVGPSGTGKTTMAENAAKLLGWKLYVIPPPQEAHELLGYRDANGKYQDTPFYRAVCETEPTLLVFDEMDRADARALTCAHTVLAGNGTVNFPHETREVSPTLARVGTLNTWGLGADAEFVGAGKLDGATLSRFPTILYIDYDIDLEEHIAVSRFGGTPETVKEALTIRDRLRAKGIRVTWTPRDTFAHCIRRHNGVSKLDSFSRSVLACLKPDQYSSVINGGY